MAHRSCYGTLSRHDLFLQLLAHSAHILILHTKISYILVFEVVVALQGLNGLHHRRHIANRSCVSMYRGDGGSRIDRVSVPAMVVIASQLFILTPYAKERSGMMRDDVGDVW